MSRQPFKYQQSAVSKSLFAVLLLVWSISIVPNEWWHAAFYLHHDTQHSGTNENKYQSGLDFEEGHTHCQDPFTDLHKTDIDLYKYTAVCVARLYVCCFSEKLEKHTFLHFTNTLNKGPPIV